MSVTISVNICFFRLVHILCHCLFDCNIHLVVLTSLTCVMCALHSCLHLSSIIPELSSLSLISSFCPSRNLWFLSAHDWTLSKSNEWLSKPRLTLEISFAFSTFVVFRSGILRLEFLAFLSAIRTEQKIEKEGYGFWDFPSLYRVLASPDRWHNESNIGGFDGCSYSWEVFK